MDKKTIPKLTQKEAYIPEGKTMLLFTKMSIQSQYS